MNCFIPFSEELVEQHPELMSTALVPFKEEYIPYTFKFEVHTPSEAANLEIAEFTGNQIQKVM